MGKRRKTKFYSVRKIAGIRREEGTGEIRCLVQWTGYSRDYDSWEPLSNLTEAECMVNAYLTAHNLSLDSLPPSPAECTECIDESPSIQHKKTVKSRKMATKTVTETKTPTVELVKNPVLRPFPAVKQEIEPIPQRLTEKLSFQRNAPRQVTEPAGSLMAVGQRICQYTPFAAIEQGVTTRYTRSDYQRLYSPTISLVPGRLGVDRPVKIIGVRGGDQGLEYAILFAYSDCKHVGVGVARHHDVMEKAAWLFARFFLLNSSVAHA